MKKCKSLSPGLGWRCELERGHIEKAQNPDIARHRAGFVRWSDQEGGIFQATMGGQGCSPTAVILDELKQQGESIISVDCGTPVPSEPSTIAALNQMKLRGKAITSITFDGAELPAEALPPEDSLSRWWQAKAADEIERTVPKAVEYGSTDLIDIGLMLARTMNRPVTEEEAAELGVFFYLIGKIARWQSAIERGERPSDDTLFDIGVYVRMAQRIRDAGAWPGVEAE